MISHFHLFYFKQQKFVSHRSLTSIPASPAPLASSTEQQYVYISFLYTWREAQRHCREFYTDLVSVRNLDENQEIEQLIPRLHVAYIGLFRDPYVWSDSSESSIRNWDLFQPDLFGKCVALLYDGFWKTELCGKTKPFFCYRSECFVIYDTYVKYHVITVMSSFTSEK